MASAVVNSESVFRRSLAAAALVGAVGLVYWNSLPAPFLFDDLGAVVNNPTLRSLWSLEIFSPPTDGSTTTGRPLVNASFALDQALSGGQPWAFRLVNVAIHAAAALVLLGIVRRTLQSPRMGDRLGPRGSSLAFAIALLWALHPLQTETVVTVAQRTESLCGLFFLLTVYAFSRGVRWPSADDVGSRAAPGSGAGGWLVISVVCCLAGMATKEVMVTAPLVVLLYDRTFVAGSFGAAWRQRRAYYAALAATWLLLAGLLWQGSGARGASAGFGLGLSPWSYLLKQCEALVLYLKLSFWPHPLVLDYGTGGIGSVTDVWWEGSLVLGLLAATGWALVRRPVPGFAAAVFFLVLAPSSSFVPLVTQTMAEHRMYLPLAVIVALVVGAMDRWLGAGTRWVAAGIALAFAGATIARNADYRDPLTIWQRNVADYPSGARGHNNLALVLQERGRAAEAIAHFDRAIELQPNYVTAFYNRGVALEQQGQTAAAVASFEQAVALAPVHVDARVNLGNALVQLGRVSEAIPQFETALRLAPAADLHYNLGVALLGADRPGEAKAQFAAALRLRADLPDVHFQLGRLAERENRTDEAEAEFTQTLRLAPNHVPALSRLGLLLARTGRLSGAADRLEAVVRLGPADASVLGNLGNVYLLQNRAAAALEAFQAALRLRPDDPRLQESAGQAQRLLGTAVR